MDDSDGTGARGGPGQAAARDGDVEPRTPALLLATWNPSKVHWMREGLAPLGLPVHVLEQGEVPEVDEDGDTCTANARLKALAVGRHPDTITVGEDSGLFVHALDGRPGPHTARWARGSDQDRTRRLLELMRDVPASARGAHFTSAIVLLFPDGHERAVEGVLEGRIRETPGPDGTGYGGVFEMPGGGALAMEPGIGTHRLRALHAATAAIRGWLTSR